MTPKVAGTWNIHNAVQARGHAVDFFLMTSSISGSVGVATESNYCVSNSFLDSFARYRRNLGLPAMAIGLGMISEVGYLHENPDKEALLVWKGLQSTNEDEFPQIIDAVLVPSYGSSADNYDTLSKSHILTGFEPLGLNELRKKEFEGTLATLNDSRASLVAGALAGEDLQYYSNSSQRLPTELTAASCAGRWHYFRCRPTFSGKKNIQSSARANRKAGSIKADGVLRYRQHARRYDTHLVLPDVSGGNCLHDIVVAVGYYQGPCVDC